MASNVTEVVNLAAPLPKAISDPYAFIRSAGAETPGKAISEGYASYIEAERELAEKKIAGAADKAAAQKEYAGAERAAIEPIFRQREKAIAGVPLPTSFEPTQTNSQDLMSLFTLTGIAGMLLGRGGGRQAAVGAQQAMTGMITGYTSGRADLVERERKNFDTNTRLLDARRKEINEAFEVAMKEATTIGVSQAKSNLEQRLAAAGADILLAETKSKGLLKGIELAQKINELAEKRQASEDSLERATQQAAARAAEGALDREARLEAARMRGEERGADKATADIKNKFEDTRDGLKSMIGVLEKADTPGLKEKWENNKGVLLRFLAERPRSGNEDTMFNQFIKQTALRSLDPEILNLFVTIATARNAYYKQINGTAVSGNEATRSFGAVVQPTDSLDVLRTKAATIAQRSADRLGDYIDSYRLAPALIEGAQTDINRARSFYEPSLPAGIPKNSVIIGKTRNGVDVYRAPDGTRHIPDARE